jgi:hypothetical protein
MIAIAPLSAVFNGGIQLNSFVVELFSVVFQLVFKSNAMQICQVVLVSVCVCVCERILV